MINTAIYAELATLTVSEILARYPLAADYLANIRLANLAADKTFAEALSDIEESVLEEFGLDHESTFMSLCSFLSAFAETDKGPADCITSLTIIGGVNKSGAAEHVELTIKAGEIVSIVGPTGSGKSRLLGDIECLAQKDTPTQRQVLVNGVVPDE